MSSDELSTTDLLDFDNVTRSYTDMIKRLKVYNIKAKEQLQERDREVIAFVSRKMRTLEEGINPIG